MAMRILPGTTEEQGAAIVARDSSGRVTGRYPKPFGPAAAGTHFEWIA